jgi:hypothetical protein
MDEGASLFRGVELVTESAPFTVLAVDVAAVAAELRASPLVAGLHPGRNAEIVTQTATGPVVGVRVDRSTLVVGVVSHPGTNSVHTVDGVRAAITSCPPGLSISVSVEARPDP